MRGWEDMFPFFLIPAELANHNAYNAAILLIVKSPN